ncbi:MAG: spermidine synthase [Planctomycetes bacterium]|nr:spermidine synthase [Planctomycetota bacterium]
MARAVPVHAIFFFSGVAGLGYELVWTRMFATGLGHEFPAMLAVVAAFFAGLAIGAWALDGVVSRSRAPGLWYAGLELVIGGWALASVVVIPALNSLAADLIGLDPSPARHWLVAFTVPLVGLLPATTAMGATLPAMERLVARLKGSGGVVGGLYAVNTAGAVAGVLATTFIVMPLAGFRVTVVALAVINVLCAAATVLGPAAGERERAPVAHELDDTPPAWRLTATLLVTGLLGIGYEITCVRVMAQVLENTVFSFTSALAVYLAGTAAGAALYQRFAGKTRFAPLLALLVQWLALACLVGIVVLGSSRGLYASCRDFFGGGLRGSVAAEMMLALLVFGPPTLLMGATFSHLVQAARGARGGVGRALAVNTIGASLAPPLFGIVLIPLLGMKVTAVIAALGYLALVPAGAIAVRRLVPTALCLPAGMAAISLDLVLVTAPPGARIIALRQGVMAVVAVTEDSQGGRLLKVNDRFFMGGTVRSFADRRQAHIPLMLHPEPKNALFLGVGSGITVGAATDHVEAVRAVELLPEVVELLGYFAPGNRLERFDVERDFVVADARRFVRAADERFDVIVADLFQPARDGSGALYTREHFEAIAARLADGGLFCQWLPVHQLDLDTLRLIVRTFLDVFPGSRAFLAHFNVQTPMLGLVTRTTPEIFPPDWYDRRLRERPGTRQALVEVALADELSLFGCLVADAEALAAFAGPGPLNTDDHPRVLFEAPAFGYLGDRMDGEHLRLLLEAWQPRADSLVGTQPARAEFAGRLDRFIAARDLFLHSSIADVRGDRDGAIEVLLESVRASGDFRTAYISGLQLASQLRASEPAVSRELLIALRDARPEAPQAPQLLREWFGE